MLADPSRREIFSDHPHFALRARFGRFSVFARSDGAADRSAWIRPVVPGLRVSEVRRQPGFISAVVISEASRGSVAIAESYHRFWRVESPPGAELEPGEGGLMRLSGLPRGRSSIELRYRAPALPFWLSLCGGVAIAAAAAAARLRGRAPQPR